MLKQMGLFRISGAGRPPLPAGLIGAKSTASVRSFSEDPELNHLPPIFLIHKFRIHPSIRTCV
jgi:hypothetical protein